MESVALVDFIHPHNTECQVCQGPQSSSNLWSLSTHRGVPGTSLGDVLLTSALLQARQQRPVREARESNTQNTELVNMQILSPTHCR